MPGELAGKIYSCYGATVAEAKARRSANESTRPIRDPYGVMGILERILDPKANGLEGSLSPPPEAPSPLREEPWCLDISLVEGDVLSASNRRNCALFILSVDRFSKVVVVELGDTCLCM